MEGKKKLDPHEGGKKFDLFWFKKTRPIIERNIHVHAHVHVFLTSFKQIKPKNDKYLRASRECTNKYTVLDCFTLFLALSGSEFYHFYT